MTKILKLIMATMVVAMFAASAVVAGEGFRGFSIGIIGNNSSFETTGEEREGSQYGLGADFTTATISNDVDFPSFFIEYTGGEETAGWAITYGLEYIPGEAELGAKSRTDSNDITNEGSNDDGTYTAKAEVEDYASFYFEPTYMLNEAFGFYAKGGISTVNLKTLESIAIGTDSSAYGDKNIFGGMYGFGLRAHTPMGIFFKLEATKTVFETVELKSTTGNKNTIKASPEQEAVRLAIGFNF